MTSPGDRSETDAATGGVDPAAAGPAGGIRVRVRLFAMQREQAGTREVSLVMPVHATVEDAWSALVERHPVLAPGRSAVQFARNGAYTDPDTPLADGDELACIPPVSGGSADGPVAPFPPPGPPVRPSSPSSHAGSWGRSLPCVYAQSRLGPPMAFAPAMTPWA